MLPHWTTRPRLDGISWRVPCARFSAYDLGHLSQACLLANVFLIVVPARGGSKGLPQNLRRVKGITLVAWTARVIKSLQWTDRAVPLHRLRGIAAEAEAAGLSAPFRRPRAISGDRIGDADVLIHAFGEMERIDGSNYDVVAAVAANLLPCRQPSQWQPQPNADWKGT